MFCCADLSLESSIFTSWSSRSCGLFMSALLSRRQPAGQRLSARGQDRVFLRMAPRVFTLCRVDRQDLRPVAIRVYAAQIGQLDGVGPLRGKESGARVTPFRRLTSDTSAVGVGRSGGIL